MKKLLAFPAFLIFGIISGLIAAHIYVQGYFISWRILENPPEPPVEIISFNNGPWVKTESGSYYNLPLSSEVTTCKRNCWMQFDEAPKDEDFIYPPENCRGRIPLTTRFQASRIVCKNYRVANVLYVYAIDKKGRVYTWQHEIGDTDSWAYFLFPIPSVGFAILCYILWLLVDYIRTQIKKRQRIEGI